MDETGDTEREETGINMIPARRPAGAFGFDTSSPRGEGNLTINPMGYNMENPIMYPLIFDIVERDNRMPPTAYTGNYRPYGDLPIRQPLRPPPRRPEPPRDTGITQFE